ncbi:MAG: recombinase family protein [Firmicutes bacterium]|nr:recombinase family protein [Bacillota bacterium]
MKPAAAYIRVSTDDQREYSPDSQLSEIRNYAERNGFFIPDKYIFIEEDGVSGKKTAKRSKFNEMIGIAKTQPKPFEAILLWKFSRFARNREDSVVFKSLLRKQLNIDVISITETIGDDKMSILIEAMIEAMDEYYSINLAEEVKRGMTEKALRGEPLSIAPYGYKMEDKQLVCYPEQADIIRKIYEDFLGGMGYMQIAKKLNDINLRTNRGSKFENRTIEYILRNPVYIGKIRWNPAGRTRRDYDNENVLITQGSHEPLISESIFAKVQDRVAEVKERHIKNSKAESSGHWLVGILKCSNCGKGLVKNGSFYLQCRGYTGARCNLSHSINIKEAEQAVLSQMEHDAQGLSSLSIFTSGKAVGNDSYIKKQITAYQRRIDRAKDAYEAGVDTLDQYKETKDRLSQEIELLKNQQEETPPPTQELNRAKLLDTAKKLNADLPMLDKKIIAKSILHHIMYNKPEKTLELYYCPV